MIDSMMVFGCSYMKGTELPQKNIQDIDAWAKKNFDRSLSSDGSIPIRQRSSKYHLIYYDIERSDKDWQKNCEQLTCTYQSAQQLKIKNYSNYAVGGYSNTAIASEVLARMNEITDNTLVIVGLTYPFRSTRLNDLWDTHTNHPKHQCSSTHNFVKQLTDYDPEKALEILRASDDVPARYLQALSIITLLRSLIKNLIIIDPISFYREVPDCAEHKIFDNKDPDIAEICIPLNTVNKQIVRDADDEKTNLIPDLTHILQTHFNDKVMPYTFAHSMCNIYNEGGYYRCVLTHPNWRVHEDFSKRYLTPYIEDFFDV